MRALSRLERRLLSRASAEGAIASRLFGSFGVGSGLLTAVLALWRRGLEFAPIPNLETAMFLIVVGGTALAHASWQRVVLALREELERARGDAG